MPANLENSAVATELEKVSFHSNPKERQCQGMFKLPQNCTHFTCQQRNAKILQVRLQQYVNHELLDVQTGFRKGRGTRDQMPTSVGSLKKQESSRKTSTFALMTMSKTLTVWITINCKILKEMGIPRPPDLPPEKSVGRSRSNSQNQTWNNGLVPNQGRSMSSLYLISPLI